MSEILEHAQALFSYASMLRRDFHRHPEIGFQEVRTAGIVARELTQLGLEVTTGIAETGVVALLEGSQPGPVVLLRFDMDALPIQEETGAEYASQNPGVMHACGHDGHMAVGLTVAKLLAARRDSLRGTLKFVFQPAEEGLGGAERMVEAGVLENPQVDRTLALHIWNEKPVGWVGIPAGPLMAGADMFTVRVEGKGGHGAMPHQAVDPIAAAAQMITALQTIVSRSLSPLESAVLSVCQISAGEAFNVIPQAAEFRGTIRSFEPHVRSRVVERFNAVIHETAAAMGCTAHIQLRAITPPVINDPDAAALVTKAAQEAAPQLAIDPQYRSMVSEDMAFMMEKVSGCYFLVGSGRPEPETSYPHHHPKFDIDEAVLPYAAAVMAAAAMEALK